jgi:hypothetical protein
LPLAIVTIASLLANKAKYERRMGQDM